MLKECFSLLKTHKKRFLFIAIIAKKVLSNMYVWLGYNFLVHGSPEQYMNHDFA